MPTHPHVTVAWSRKRRRPWLAIMLELAMGMVWAGFAGLLLWAVFLR